MEFTDNQKESIHDAILAADFSGDSASISSKWSPDLDGSIGKSSFSVTADRKVILDDQELEGEWKGRSVDDDIVAALAWSYSPSVASDEDSSTTSEEPPSAEDAPKRTPLSERMPPSSIPPMTTFWKEPED